MREMRRSQRAGRRDGRWPRVIRRQKHNPDREVVVVRDRDAEAGGLSHKEGRGYLRQYPGAVSRLRVSRNSAPVRQIHDRFERLVEHEAALVAVDVGNETYAARIVLETWVVQLCALLMGRTSVTGLPSGEQPCPYRMGRYRFIS